MSTMMKTGKCCFKGFFRLCGLEVKRSPRFRPYAWLGMRNIQTIIDVGANIGQFALEFNRLFPTAAIYSFEPLRSCYHELRKRTEKVPAIHTFNCALGDRNGKAEIFHNRYSPSSSLLPMNDLHIQAFPFTSHTAVEEIEMQRLDDFAGQLDIRDDLLIKIDVQGFEDKVISGGGQLISKASVLIVETSFRPLYRGQLLFDGLYSLLKPKGFTYAGTEHTIRDPNTGCILQCDSIFCRTEQSTETGL